MLGRLTKRLLVSVLDGEITDHLGCDKDDLAIPVMAPALRPCSPALVRFRSACLAVGQRTRSGFRRRVPGPHHVVEPRKAVQRPDHQAVLAGHRSAIAGVVVSERTALAELSVNCWPLHRTMTGY